MQHTRFYEPRSTNQHIAQNDISKFHKTCLSGLADQTNPWPHCQIRNHFGRMKKGRAMGKGTVVEGRKTTGYTSVRSLTCNVSQFKCASQIQGNDIKCNTECQTKSIILLLLLHEKQTCARAVCVVGLWTRAEVVRFEHSVTCTELMLVPGTSHESSTSPKYQHWLSHHILASSCLTTSQHWVFPLFQVLGIPFIPALGISI